ncbi:MAG: HD-GYP domain-containing protein [Rhodocyclaceae bacterium]|nr:HD-GYP domain-containing protein [Rhodocyclaceae bacterium]
MKEIVASDDLEIGMFVADLDRPWIDSPFLLQGFLIEDEETLDRLRGLCRYVSVDRTLSVGDAHRGRRIEDIASRVGESLQGRPRRAAVVDADDGTRMPDFLRILRTIRSGQLDDLSRFEDAGDRAPDRLAAHAQRIRDRTAVERELIEVAPRYQETGSALAHVLDDVKRDLVPDLGPLREGVEDMVRSVARNPDALLWLTRLKASHAGSYQHALHASVHMMIFGRSLGMGEEATQLLGLAGMLHDVGKLRLPERLLRKNRALTDLEYQIFKTHVDYSLAILRDSPQIPKPVLEVVERHHERFDGSGYPHGLAGDKIGMLSEIAGLVDSYSAMTNLREYRSVFSTHQALEDLIKLRDTRHRATLVDQFVQCIGIYPVGSLVELNTGEVAVVIGQHRVRRLKPRVMVLLAPDKTQNRYPPLLDLLYDPLTPAGEVYAIVRALPPDAHGIDPQEYYLG